MEIIDELKTYSLAELESVMGVKKRTLFRYIESGKLKAVKVGRMWRVPGTALKAYFAGAGDIEALCGDLWKMLLDRADDKGRTAFNKNEIGMFSKMDNADYLTLIRDAIGRVVEVEKAHTTFTGILITGMSISPDEKVSVFLNPNMVEQYQSIRR